MIILECLPISPLAQTLGKAYLFDLTGSKLKVLSLGFSIRMKEFGHQGCKDLISPHCLATDGHCDLGWI